MTSPPGSVPAVGRPAARWDDARVLRLLRRGRGRPAGLLVLSLLVVAIALDPWPENSLRTWWFDGYQRLTPREPASSPAVVVAVDEASLERHGQWPWPRDLLATLVARILDQGPAAVGLDLLFPEPDRLSPAQWAATRADLDPATRTHLAALEDHDSRFARELARGPVALAVAGSDEVGSEPGLFPPVRELGAVDRGALPTWRGAVRSLPVLDQAAPGHGVIGVHPEPDGVVRRPPLAVVVGDRLAPSLALEMLRLASGADSFQVVAMGGTVQGVDVAGLAIPSDPEGRFRVYFSPTRPERFVSAADVLAGRVAPDTFTRRFAIVGVTGLGVVDFPATPVAPRMVGSEVHAQLLENIFDAQYLTRPSWAPLAEAGLVLATGLLLVVVAPRTRTGWYPALGLASVGLYVATGLLAFAQALWLLDATLPALAYSLLFVMMLTIALSTAEQERRRLDAALAVERDRALRAAGELEAARRIQMGILPRVEADLTADPRYELAVDLEPARAVGGDLYDFFLLDAQRLFFVVGDVAGKGVPASLFMAITKALWKSAALRPAVDVAEIMNNTNREVSRDNPEMLFVTAFSGILHLDSGELTFAVAGHDAPLCYTPAGTIRRLEGDGGPPLCVLEDFEFPLGRTRLAPGEGLCIYTDGVTEATDAMGAMFGSERLWASVGRAAAARCGPRGMVEAVRREVTEFVAGAPQADDLTLLVLQWNG